MGLFIWNMLSKFERAIMVATSVVIVVLVMIQGILRYVFKHPIMGVEEMATLLGFWMYFIGAAMVALMTNWTWNYVTWSIKTYERSPSLGIPMIYSQVALFVAALLMLLYTLVEFMDYFLQLIGKKPIQISFDTDSEKEIN